MEASDLSEMENSVEKKRKSRHVGINTHYTTKNKKGKQLQLDNSSRCLDKKTVSKAPKISIPQYDSSASKSSTSEIGKLYTVMYL